ncbi:hypothetical protein GMORB2_1320 [Geosmithia morbida]|uniref:Transmembrane protein n=1 Tax=Geosmithia morbida TaxID=1094350 RepID=A0A9P4Z3S0_9HYPO|nr:uncharacterized protein GMORB2_1320 [Geosmithia morbida]KAF4126074.1 hypothetical protein GMORB2_1320 [Geosmithia morbida]
MASLGAQAKFERARWRLSFLSPMWALQLGLALAMVGIFSWQLGTCVYQYATDGDKTGFPTFEVVCESVGIVLSFVAAVCAIFTVARYFAEALTPWAVIVAHIIQLSCGGAVLAVQAVAHVNGVRRRCFVLVLVFGSILVCSSGALAVYAIVARRRISSYTHSYTLDIKGYNFDSSNGSVPRGLLDRSRFSSASSRTSYLSSTRQSSGGAYQGVAATDPTPSPADPRAAYSHERSTEFDKFVAARRQLPAVEPGVWHGRGRSSSGGTSSLVSPLSADDADAVVHLGTVPVTSTTNRPGEAKATSDRGLVSVPEEERSSIYSGDDGTGSVKTQGTTQTVMLERARAMHSLLGSGYSKVSSDDDEHHAATSRVPERIVVSPPHEAPVLPELEWMRGR